MGTITHPQYTANGVEIVEGLRVWTNDLELAVVVITGTHADPTNQFHQYWDGWFTCYRPDGTRYGIFNGERMTTRHPFSGERA